MKSMRILLLGLLSIGVAGPATAQLGDPQQPGSVLVFPKFIRGTFNDAAVSKQTMHAVTELEISVVCPTVLGPNGCANGQIVRLRAHWVCPPQDRDGISSPPTCQEKDFDLETTVNGSLYFNPEGVVSECAPGIPKICVVTANAFPNNSTTSIPIPNCQRGYLIVWVVNQNDQPIKFDGLIGDAILREGSSSARGYNAIAIQAGPDVAGFTTGSRTTTDADPALHFDGVSYMQVPGKIVGTVRYENFTAVQGGNVQTDLTLLTLDVLSNLGNPVTTVKLNFYDVNEELHSTATSFVCWAETELTSIDFGFIVQNMGRKGLVESTDTVQQFPNLTTITPVSVLGLVETIEFTVTGAVLARDYAYSLGGDTPVTTSFVP